MSEREGARVVGEGVRRALVVVAHPDDAEFGCAGTVAVWTRAGHEVNYLICTRGQKGTSDPEMTSERLAQIREQEQRAAAILLGVRDVVFLDYCDGEVEVTLQLRGEITRAIRFYRPDVVFSQDPTTLFVGDEFINHPDHRAVGMAAVDAIYPTARDRLQFPEHLRAGLEPHRVLEVYLFGTEHPNHWVEISETIDLKIAALLQHKSQVGGQRTLAERIRERARLAGEAQGMAYAEAFRRIVMRR